MVRLEKINLDEKSWWSAKATPHTRPDFNSHKAEVKECPKCKKESKVIFKQGWTCLNSDPAPSKVRNTVREKTTCTEFFRFGSDIDDTTLEYTEEFFLERTNFKELRDPEGLEVIPGSLKPRLLTMEDVQRLGNFGFEEECKRGVVCPLCGCCCRRVEWDKWVCESSTSNGHFEYSLPARIITADQAIANGNCIPPSMRTNPEQTHKDVVNGIIDRSEFPEGKAPDGTYKVYRYGMTGEQTTEGKPGAIIGYVYHLKSSANLNKLPNGPDDLFEDLQRADLGLKRNPSRHTSGKSPGLGGFQMTNEW
jgi:hypothetical protein